MVRRDKQAIWHEVLESIKVSVSTPVFNTWFSQTHLIRLEDSDQRALVEIGCNSSYVKATIEGRYFGLIQDSLSKSLEKPVDLIFTVSQNPSQKISDKTLETPLFSKDPENEEFLDTLRSLKIRPGFTFENFAVSSSNQMAWAAAEAVAENPGTAYNPLFIWGGVGVGKTHLMNAVGIRILEKDRDSKILLCTAEDFTNDIVEGIRNKSTQAVRNKYRRLNVLLIDDIQFIAGKDTAQEEFFHTFNSVTGAGGQIILTSDKPPSEISKLEERLKSRFEAGLIVDISPADFELRCAIIQIKTSQRGIELPMDFIQMVAGNLDSARKIEGFLIRLFSEAKIRKSEVTLEFITSLLEKGEKPNGQILRVDPLNVITAVSEYYSIGKRVLLGDSRARPIARPRQVLMYILRTQLGLPFQEVGRLAGGRDHSTVMHAVQKITVLASQDVHIREDLMGIKSKY